MKVSFTPKEYARLLELLYLGGQVVSGAGDEDRAVERRYADIEQKVLTLAPAFGCGDFVEQALDGRMMPSEKFVDDERLRQILGTYQNDVFWRELVARLAERDLAVERVQEGLAGQVSGQGTDARLKELEEAYWQEFEKHDLGRLLLLRGGRG